MRSWMYDRYAKLKVVFHKNIVHFACGSAGKNIPSFNVRTDTAVALVGIFLIIGSVSTAIGVSVPDIIHASLAAMLPKAFEKSETSPLVSKTITAPGEIIAESELSLAARVQGSILQVLVDVGDTIREGDLIVRIDDVEAQNAVRDAEQRVNRAELSLAQADSLASALAEDRVTKPPEDELFASLNRAYIRVSDIFPSLSRVITGLNGILYGGFFVDPTGTNHLVARADYAAIENPQANEMKLRAMEEYEDAKKKHSIAIARLRSVPGNPDAALLEEVLQEASDAVTAIADATKATNDLYIFLKNHFGERGLRAPPVFREFESALGSYTDQLADQTALVSDAEAEVRAVREQPPPPTPADSARAEREAELELREAQQALAQAQARLALYEVKAPVDGVVVDHKQLAHALEEGETVATLMTGDVLATASVSEGDIVHIKLGQGTLLSFDDPDLQIRGRVAAIGNGEVKEDGTVRFSVTIVLEPDERVKPGMHVTVRFLAE